MYFGIGFLAATLIAIAIVPFAIKRAVRLTTLRAISTIPTSLTEALAGKDGVRAMFAVAVKQLEFRTQELVKRIATQGTQLGHHSTVNVQLKQALDEKSKLVAALEVRECAMMSRENALIQELLVLRDESQKNRDSMLSMRLPPAFSPWKKSLHRNTTCSKAQRTKNSECRRSLRQARGLRSTTQSPPPL